jgi:hypothetical protein
MSKSHLMFSITETGDMFFTGMISQVDLIRGDLSNEARLILTSPTPDTPMSDKLMALAELYTTLEDNT